MGGTHGLRKLGQVKFFHLKCPSSIFLFLFCDIRPLSKLFFAWLYGVHTRTKIESEPASFSSIPVFIGYDFKVVEAVYTLFIHNAFTGKGFFLLSFVKRGATSLFSSLLNSNPVSQEAYFLFLAWHRLRHTRHKKCCSLDLLSHLIHKENIGLITKRGKMRSVSGVKSLC